MLATRRCCELRAGPPREPLAPRCEFWYASARAEPDVTGIFPHLRGGVRALTRGAARTRIGIQGSGIESGATVFEVDSFCRSVFIAQSPLLADQMCIAADMERVLEIGPRRHAVK